MYKDWVPIQRRLFHCGISGIITRALQQLAFRNGLYYQQLYSPRRVAQCKRTNIKLEMWANAQRDGRPAEYMWRLLFNAAKFG